jgi:hypothetical protein
MFSEPTKPIPHGYCHCGCGQKTNIAKYTCKRHKCIAGEPLRFVYRHFARLYAKRPLAELFWSKVAVGGPDDCWPWIPGTDKHGYGRFHIRPKSVLAHRFAYELVNGPIPDGLRACHTCNHPPCCNPAHIYAGTDADNIHDSMRAGTHVPPPRYPGSKNRNAKLTESKVRFIRDTYTAGKETQVALARRFGVSQTAVSFVILHRSWRHVP